MHIRFLSAWLILATAGCGRDGDPTPPTRSREAAPLVRHVTPYETDPLLPGEL